MSADCLPMTNMMMMMTNQPSQREQERNKRRNRNKAQNWRNNSKYIYDASPSIVLRAQKRSVIAHTELTHTQFSNSMRNIKNNLLLFSFYHFFLLFFCEQREKPLQLWCCCYCPLFRRWKCTKVTAAPRHNYYLFSSPAFFSILAHNDSGSPPALSLSPHTAIPIRFAFRAAQLCAHCVHTLSRAQDAGKSISITIGHHHD